MSIQRRVNWLSQQRAEVPDMRSIESAVSADFDTVAESFISGPDTPYIINGFELNFASNPIGSAASSLQVVVANGALLHTTASQSGTFYLVPAGTPNVTLNAAVVSNVSGAFIPSSNNYVGIDYYRFQDPTTDTQVYLWDPTSNEEDQEIAPAAIILNYEFVITSSVWASNILPIAIVTTDASNNVLAVTDARPLLFRLGTGGSSPNPFYTYPWPEGQTENSPTSSSNLVNPFYGGDKGITDLKDWMNAVMTQLLGITGGPYWYSASSGGNIPDLREDATATVLTGDGSITHSETIPGRINWSSAINLRVIGSELTYEIAANPSGSSVSLVDNEVAYLELTRDVAISPNLIWTNGSAVVTSVGSVAWTTGLYSVNANGYGDWIKVASGSHAAYYQIQTINSASQVTLTINYAGASTGAGGAVSQYAYGLYTLPGVTGGLRDVQLADRGSVPISPNTFWLLLRSDDGGSLARVYVKWLGVDLQQGDSEEISGPQLTNVLNYIGSPIESSTTPEYVSAWSVYQGGSPVVLPQITSITTGAASTMASEEYFLIYSSTGAREYYVWVKKDGSGTDPRPIASATPIEWDVTTGQTSTQTAASLVTALNSTFFSDFTATNIANVLTVKNNSAGATSNAANDSIGAPFSVSTTQSGTGNGNFVIQDADNLTLAIKKLDEAIESISISLDSPSYDEVVEIVASGATPPTSINGPILAGTNITLPNNTREGDLAQFYTVGKGTLMVFWNGQFIDVESGAYTEVGAANTPSNQIQIQVGLDIGDELEFRMSGGGGGAGGGGGIGPSGPPGPTGPTGPAGADALNGPINISTKTSNYSVLTTDGFILVDCTSGNVTLTLPTAASYISKAFYFKKIDSSSFEMIIQANGSELIDGSNTIQTNVQYEAFSIAGDGTQGYLF